MYEVPVALASSVRTLESTMKPPAPDALHSALYRAMVHGARMQNAYAMHAVHAVHAGWRVGSGRRSERHW